MQLTREEFKLAHNNIMTIMENRVMSMCGCDRTTANLIANEVLNLNMKADRLIMDEEETNCNTCVYLGEYQQCRLGEEGCQTSLYECYTRK